MEWWSALPAAAAEAAWVSAGAACGAAAAAILLLGLAWVQMRATTRQAEAAGEQVELTREEARRRDEAAGREDSRRRAAEEARMLQLSAQLRGLEQIALATRDAARATL